MLYILCDNTQHQIQWQSRLIMLFWVNVYVYVGMYVSVFEPINKYNSLFVLFLSLPLLVLHLVYFFNGSERWNKKPLNQNINFLARKKDLILLKMNVYNFVVLCIIQICECVTVFFFTIRIRFYLGFFDKNHFAAQQQQQQHQKHHIPSAKSIYKQPTYYMTFYVFVHT